MFTKNRILQMLEQNQIPLGMQRFTGLDSLGFRNYCRQMVSVLDQGVAGSYAKRFRRAGLLPL